MSPAAAAKRFLTSTLLVAPDVAGPLPNLSEREPAEADFRLLADNLPTLCWIARGDGYIVWYNRRWHDYCGTTPVEMEGWGWETVHDPAVLPRVKDRWSASIAHGEPFEMTFPLRGADGIFRPFMTRISPLRDGSGQVVRWFGVNTGIVEQVEAEEARDLSQATYDVLTNAMPQMVWSTLPDGYHDFYNKQWYEFTGVPAGSTDGEAWNGIFHPEDQERAWTKWRHSLTTGDPYEIEYRLRHRSGEYRWTLGRALPVRDAEGYIQRWIGTCTDIHTAKVAAEHNEVLSHELSHRIKNIFAIIGGLIGLSARHHPAAKPFAQDVTNRIAALGRAHEFARPHSERSRPSFGEATLVGILSEIFLPYQADGDMRIVVRGADTVVDDRGATPLALLFHELATNAAKYGALSLPDGRVAIDVQIDHGIVRAVWRESGGPTIASPPDHVGFGTQLVALSVERQLGGSVERQWEPSGLVVIATTPLSSLVRS